MKNKKFSWLSLAFFCICILMVFTASECKGTVEEEVNNNIAFARPEDESYKGIGRNDNICYVDILINRNDNKQNISLGASDTTQGLDFHFYNEILYGSNNQSSSTTTLKISNILSLSGNFHPVSLSAQAPGQTVYTTFYLTKQYFSLNPSADILYIEQGGQGSIDIGFIPINEFGCEVSLQIIDEPKGVYASWDPLSPEISAGETAHLTLEVPSSTNAGNYTVSIIGTSTSDCDFIEKDTASFTLSITQPALWTDVTPDPAPPYLYDIDGNYAVGQNGTILRAMNEGLNWEYLPSGTSVTLRAVLVTGGTVYIAGDNGTVLKGGGSSWADLSIPEAPDIYDIHKVDSHLWAVGTDGAGAVAFKSRNDGMTWIKSNTPYNQSYYPLFYGVSFADTSNGILVGTLHRNIFITQDAGENWTIIPVDPEQLEYIYGNITCGVGGSILSTPDGGVTWQTLYSNPITNFASFSGPIFVGSGGKIVRQQSGSYNLEDTGITNFQSDLFGVTLNGTYIAVGGGLGGVGVIIKRQPL